MRFVVRRNSDLTKTSPLKAYREIRTVVYSVDFEYPQRRVTVLVIETLKKCMWGGRRVIL